MVILKEECYPRPGVFGNLWDDFTVVTMIEKAICIHGLGPGKLNALKCSQFPTYKNYSASSVNSVTTKKYH